MDRRTCKILEDYMLDCMADSAHDKEHVYRVLYHGLAIARTEEDADIDVVIGACLLHDICRKEQSENPAVDHALAGAKGVPFSAGTGFFRILRRKGAGLYQHAPLPEGKSTPEPGGKDSVRRRQAGGGRDHGNCQNAAV